MKSDPITETLYNCCLVCALENTRTFPMDISILLLNNFTILVLIVNIVETVRWCQFTYLSLKEDISWEFILVSTILFYCVKYTDGTRSNLIISCCKSIG